MVTQLVEYFVHLKGGQDGFNQDGAATNVGDAHLVFGEGEDAVPEARFQVTLHLGQIEIRGGVSLESGFDVMEEVQAEIEERRRDRLSID